MRKGISPRARFRRAVEKVGVCCLVVSTFVATNAVSSRAYGQTGNFARSTNAAPTASENAERQSQIVFFSIPIGVASAPVLAKPSDSSYQTGAILKDRYVEIYFKNEDGFCAIRPPRGSFSWINGKFVKVEDESNARVVSPTGKPIPARVGGESPASSTVVQVVLQNNQKIKILGKVALQDGSVWYKISPPPGEFRWIRESSLIRDPALAQLPDKLMRQEEFLKRYAETADATASPRERANSNLSTEQFPPRPATQTAPETPQSVAPLPDAFAPRREATPAPTHQPAPQPSSTPPYPGGNSNNDEELFLTLPEFDVAATAVDDAIDNALGVAADKAQAAGERMQTVAADLSDSVDDAFGKAVDKAQTTGQQMQLAAADLSDSVDDAFGKAVDKAQAAGQRMQTVAADLSDSVDDAFGKTVDKAQAAGQRMQEELNRLNLDALQALRDQSASPKALTELKARAEQLANEAAEATDEKARSLANSLAETLSKAADQKLLASKQTIPNAIPQAFDEAVNGALGAASRIPNANLTAQNGMSAPNGRIIDGRFYPEKFVPGEQLDVSGFPNGQFINGAFIPDEFQPGSVARFEAPRVETSPTPNVAPNRQSIAANSDKASKVAPNKTPSRYSRLSFAFSGANNPFRRGRDAAPEAPSGISNRELKTVGTLPALLPSAPQELVPPPNYDFANQILGPPKSYASLTPGPLRSSTSESRALAQTTPKEKTISNATTSAVPQRAIVDDSAVEKSVAVWNAAGNGNENQIELASSQEGATFADEEEEEIVAAAPPPSNSKIRQTSGFTPVTSQSFDHFDSSGTLVELSDAAKGAPRYALLADDFHVLAYLQEGKNISLSRFVGKKVVLNGASGTVTVDGDTKKLIEVSSIFLKK